MIWIKKSRNIELILSQSGQLLLGKLKGSQSVKSWNCKSSTIFFPSFLFIECTLPEFFQFINSFMKFSQLWSLSSLNLAGKHFLHLSHFFRFGSTVNTTWWIGRWSSILFLKSSVFSLLKPLDERCPDYVFFFFFFFTILALQAYSFIYLVHQTCVVFTSFIHHLLQGAP